MTSQFRVEACNCSHSKRMVVGNSLFVPAEGESTVLEMPCSLYIKCKFSERWGLFDMLKSPIRDWDEHKKYPFPVDLYYDLYDEARDSGDLDPILVLGKQGVPPFCIYDPVGHRQYIPAPYINLVEDLRLVTWKNFLDAIAADV